MKQLLMAIFVIAFVMPASAQKFQKATLDSTGLVFYGFCKMEFTKSKSEDGSTIYNGFCEADSINYGIICVQLKDKILDLEKAESVMINYTNHLAKNVFEIKQFGSYGKGHRLNQDENTRGILDYWTDDNNTNYKVKSWTNGAFIVFMCVNSARQFSENKANLFLDGLRFPKN